MSGPVIQPVSRQCPLAGMLRVAPKANGAGIAASPTLACGCPGRVWAIAFPGVVGGVTAVMHVRAPRVPSHRGCQHRDAHRIGSCWFRTRPVSRRGLPLPAASSSGGPKGPAFLARLIRRRPVPSGGWFGSEDPLLPPGGSVTALQPVVPVLPFHDAEASLPFHPSRPPLGDLTAPRHSLHLRFARFVPGNAPGVFSDAAAGIVAVSISFSFPFPFQQFPAETSSSVSSSRQGNAATQKRVAQAESS